jgi:hypothetical protein
MITLRLYREGVERNGGYALSSFAQTTTRPGRQLCLVHRVRAHGAIEAGWRNLIVAPDVPLHAQRARHASAPATGRAATAAGEGSAAVQGSGRAAAAGSAGRPADARSDSAGCGPATFLRWAAAKVADGLERVDIGADLQDGSLGRLHYRALRRPDGRLPTLRSSWLASTLPATCQRSILIIGNSVIWEASPRYCGSSHVKIHTGCNRGVSGFQWDTRDGADVVVAAVA